MEGRAAVLTAPDRPREATGQPSLMVVAGEASGDLHGATLARALVRLAPETALVGMGGDRMGSAGVRLLAGIEEGSVVGISEVARRLPALLRALRRLGRHLAESRPSGLVLIDFPDFNLRLARRASALGIPVIYFIPPQVWAWRRGRLRTIARHVSRVLAVFPFEVGLYQEAGVPVEFVGHPLLDVLPPLDRAEARQGHASERETLIGLLPGSRSEEVRRHLPVLLEAAAMIHARRPGTRVVLALAPTIPIKAVAPWLQRGRVEVRVVTGETYRVMAGADLLLAASGTATLEAAWFGTPMVVLYRVSRLSYLIGRLLVRGVTHISLPNIIAGRGVVPELIQHAATPVALAGEGLALLEDPAARAAQLGGLQEVRARLGQPGAAERAARAILHEVGVPATP